MSVKFHYFVEKEILILDENWFTAETIQQDDKNAMSVLL